LLPSSWMCGSGFRIQCSGFRVYELDVGERNGEMGSGRVTGRGRGGKRASFLSDMDAGRRVHEGSMPGDIKQDCVFFRRSLSTSDAGLASRGESKTRRSARGKHIAVDLMARTMDVQGEILGS
jgi:hypothetical protein